MLSISKYFPSLNMDCILNYIIALFLMFSLCTWLSHLFNPFKCGLKVVLCNVPHFWICPNVPFFLMFPLNRLDFTEGK